MSSDLSKIKLSFNVKDLNTTTLSGQATPKHIRNNVRQKKRIDVCYTCSRSLIMHSLRSLRFSFQGTQQKHSTAEKCAKLAALSRIAIGQLSRVNQLPQDQSHRFKFGYV